MSCHFLTFETFPFSFNIILSSKFVVLFEKNDQQDFFFKKNQEMSCEVYVFF